MDWYLGTVGFGYKQWRGVFYPPGLQPRNFLAYYATIFNSVEIDSTFYGTPQVEKVQRWGDAVPDTFRFCLKTPQQITHDLRLADAAKPMATFVNAARRLEHKLGAILIQLPPDFTAEKQSEETLRSFLGKLPPLVRYAIEFRHRSWDRPETAALLREYKICWVAADYVIMPRKIYPTTDFLYLRFLGRHGRYETKDRELRDPSAELRSWHERIAPRTSRFTAAFGYFNNDYAGYSPESCNKFKHLWGLPTARAKVAQQAKLL